MEREVEVGKVRLKRVRVSVEERGRVGKGRIEEKWGSGGGKKRREGSGRWG